MIFNFFVGNLYQDFFIFQTFENIDNCSYRTFVNVRRPLRTSSHDNHSGLTIKTDTGLENRMARVIILMLFCGYGSDHCLPLMTMVIII